MPVTRQFDREFGEFAGAARDPDRAAMLLRDDVPADREPEPRAFAGRLGREERLKQLVPDFERDAGTVVAHPDLDRVAQIAARLAGKSAKASNGGVRNVIIMGN